MDHCDLLPVHDAPSRRFSRNPANDREFLRMVRAGIARTKERLFVPISLFQPDKLTGMEGSPADGGYRKPCGPRGFR
jgi:hypothetical protein